MEPRARYQVNTPDVTHEVIEGEAVIINLATGSYYSLDRAGAEIWTLLGKNATVETIVEHISRRYDGEPPEIEASVRQLISQLQTESLIVPASGSVFTQALEDAASSGENGNRPMFQSPALQKFTDMQELLLLDPIHEVDERGWPHRAR